MKKILVVALLGFIGLEAYEIQRTYVDGNYKVYVAQCKKGATIYVNKNLLTGRYYVKSNSYESLESAINKHCTTTNKIIIAKKDTVMCRKEFDMKDALKSSMGFMLYRLGPEKSCGPLDSNVKVKLIKTYNRKQNGLCSDYLKIESGDGIWFMNVSKC